MFTNEKIDTEKHENLTSTSYFDEFPVRQTMNVTTRGFFAVQSNGKNKTANKRAC